MMDQVLLSSEIEFYVDTMKPTQLEDIGSHQYDEQQFKYNNL